VRDCLFEDTHPSKNRKILGAQWHVGELRGQELLHPVPEALTPSCPLISLASIVVNSHFLYLEPKE
jgi:hypothetical protein